MNKQTAGWIYSLREVSKNGTHVSGGEISYEVNFWKIQITFFFCVRLFD
jgi:hypothetical protein